MTLALDGGSPNFYKGVPFKFPKDTLTGLTQLQQLTAAPVIDYDFIIEQVDGLGNVQADLTAYAIHDGASISRDSTQVQHATLSMNFQSDLTWGETLIRPSMLISSKALPDLGSVAYPLGVYVATVAPKNLQNALPFYALTGYDKNYLLQGQLADTYLGATGTTYLSNVSALLVLAGAMPSGGTVSNYLNYTAAWAVKTLPNDMNYPYGTGATAIGIINDMLAASGCRPIFTDQYGKFVAQLAPIPAQQTNEWAFAAGQVDGLTVGDFPYDSAVVFGQSVGGVDAWNAPNAWRFVQNGLDFVPIEGSGQYTVQDTINQAEIGRTIWDVVLLDASGQTDLQTQGDVIVAAAKAALESVTLQTAQWPVAWHYDVFQYVDPNLPNTPVRKLQAQQWVLPLDGGPMSWTTAVVGPQ